MKITYEESKAEFDQLVRNEHHYDSPEEQINLRNEFLKVCEREIENLQLKVERLDVEDPLERHLKSTAWNLNRIANCVESLVGAEEMRRLLHTTARRNK